MRRAIDVPLFWGAFAPTLSLDELYAGPDLRPGEQDFDIIDESPLVDKAIEQAEARCAVNKFVQSLSPRDQEIVHGVFWRGLTQTEVASRLKVSKMAISKALARIGRIGRSALADLGNSALIN